jgi:hypothetical protein
MEPLSELKSESDTFVACRFIQLSYKGKSGQGTRISTSDTAFQARDVSSLHYTLVVDSDGLEPPTRKASTCRSTLELRVRKTS